MFKYFVASLLLIFSVSILANCPNVTVSCTNYNLCRNGEAFSLNITVHTKWNKHSFQCEFMDNINCGYLDEQCNTANPSVCKGNCRAVTQPSPFWTQSCSYDCGGPA